MASGYKIHEQDNIYFITFATVGWIDIFTRPIYKHIVIDSLNFCSRNKGLEIYSWVIMSNHLHFIVKASNGNLSDVLRDFKKFTSQTILREVQSNPYESRRKWMLHSFKYFGITNPNNKYLQLWQQDNHPILTDYPEIIDQKMNYIHNNPVKAEIVDLPHEYKYSSARDYAGIKGEVDVVLLI